MKVIQETSFETLESLAEHTVNHVRDELSSNQISYSHVKLQLKKPRAVMFADAPCVEVIRKMPEPGVGGNASTSKVVVSGLKIIKPYTDNPSR